MKKIHFYGDSTTYGQTKKADGTSVVSFWNVPDVTQRLMDDKFGAGAVQVSNKGVSGSRIEQWVNGEPGVMPTLASRLTAADSPDIVVFEIGINNASQPAYDRVAFCGYLQQVASLCATHGKTLILGTPNPVSDARAANLDDIQGAVRAFAVWFGIPLIDYYWEIANGLPNWKALLSDYTHPGNTLYCFKGALAAGFLMQFV